jgi:hypothetical protein
MIKSKFLIDKMETMYPSLAHYADVNELGDLGYLYTQALSTTYGYVLEGEANFEGEESITAGKYFCRWTKEQTRINYTGKLVLFIRVGFKGQNLIGGPVEESGRLSYIDGSSDTILVYPPRIGDPIFSVVYFPKNTEQTFQMHSSVRMGAIISGGGYICFDEAEENNVSLTLGDMICFEQNERHRIKTTGNILQMIVYNPQGNWGPQDHNKLV